MGRHSLHLTDEERRRRKRASDSAYQASIRYQRVRKRPAPARAPAPAPRDIPTPLEARAYLPPKGSIALSFFAFPIDASERGRRRG